MKRKKTVLLLLVLLSVASMQAQETKRIKGELHFEQDSIYLTTEEVPQFLMEHFNEPEGYEFRLLYPINTYVWGDKSTHTGGHYQQYYNGYQIKDARSSVFIKNGILQMMYADIVLYDTIGTVIFCPLEEAIEIAKAYTIQLYEKTRNKQVKMEDMVVELTNWYNGESLIDTLIVLDKTPRLCYSIAVGVGILADFVLFVDVQGLEVIKWDYDGSPLTGTASTRYYGSRSINTKKTSNIYVLRDESRGQGISTVNMKKRTTGTAIEFTDDNNAWTSSEYHNNNKDDGAMDAHWSSMMVYDYFQDKHGRESYDGNGAQIVNLIHYDTNYCNAKWKSTSRQFAFGDGNTQYDIFTNLGIVVHEFGHAVCQYSANLGNSGEIGAINESMSDIWAACVKHHNPTWEDKWRIVVGDSSSYKTLRDMRSPKTKNHPDTYKGEYWADTAINSTDNGGVHTNSGVMNRWFYLLCEGNSGLNDNHRFYHVEGIPQDTAARILYKAETDMFNSLSGYKDVCGRTILAAQTLYPTKPATVQSVIDAWYAVGLGADLYVRDSLAGTGPYPAASGCLWNSPDIWLEDTLFQPIDNPKGGEPCYVCVKIHNASNIPSSGQERLEVNWAKAGCQLCWSEDWDGSSSFECGQPKGGCITPTSGVVLPSIPAYDSTVVRLQWTPPQPSAYYYCDDSGEPWHYCLLASVRDFEPMRLEDSVSVPVYRYVTWSDNVAWKNVSVLDREHRRAMVTFANPFAVEQPFRMRLKTVSHGQSWHQQAMVTLRLSSVLMEVWQQAGGVVQGGVYLGNGRFRVTDGEFILPNLLLPPQLNPTVTVEVEDGAQGALPIGSYKLDLIEETAGGEVIGGERFVYKVVGLPQLAMRSKTDSIQREGEIVSLTPNPAVQKVEVKYRQCEPSQTELLLYDARGIEQQRRRVMQTEGRVVLDLSAQATGRYMVCLAIGGQIIDSKPLIVNK